MSERHPHITVDITGQHHPRSGRFDVQAFMENAELDYLEREGAPKGSMTTEPQAPTPREAPVRVLSSQSDLLVHERTNKNQSLKPSHLQVGIDTYRPKNTTLVAAQKARAVYDRFPLRAKRGAAIGAAALTIAGFATLLPSDSESKLSGVDFSELAETPVASANVSYAGVPIYYGVEIHEPDKSPYTLYISEDENTTGIYTMDRADTAKLQYPEIISSLGPNTGKEQKLVHRMPALYYNNRLDTSLIRTGDNPIAFDGKNFEVNRSAFSLAGIEYHPEEQKTPSDTQPAPDYAYLGYEPVQIAANADEGGFITADSVKKLNLLFDADPDTKGGQPHPDITKAIDYLARYVISNREWDCYQQVRERADEVMIDKIDTLVEEQTGEKFNADRRVKFKNDYPTPAQAYIDSQLRGDVNSALKNSNFIIDEDKLATQAKVSCEVLPDTAAQNEKGKDS